MYQVLCDNNLLFDHGVDDLKIINPRLTLEVNKVGRFDFTIYPTHPLYGLIQKLKSVIEVYQDGVLLFRGRPLNETMRFDKSKDITCEGDLAFFNDTIMRPYNFTGSISDFLQTIITSHNAQAGADKQFTLGNVTVTDPNNLIVRSSISHDNSWSVINDKLISSLGGYIIIRRQSNINYIDYLVDSPYQSLQTIELGKNLLDVIRETRSDDIITALIPLGARLVDENGNETDQRLTIASVNGGLDYVHDAAAVAEYGWIFGTQTWDDVTDANNLLTRANQELAININLGTSIELKAIDLSMVDQLIDEIRLFDYVQVTSEHHGIDTMALITKLNIDLLQPNNNTVTLGFSYESFTDKQFQSEQVIKRIESDYVTNEKVTEVKNTLTTVSSNIKQEADKIRTEVSETYTTKSELEEVRSTISTDFEQTNRDFTWTFKELEQVIENLEGETQTKFTEIVKYIRFVDGNIELGEVNNPIKLILQNDRISFTQNGAEVAYISDNILYITDGRFLNSLRIGNFAFTPRSNGSLSFGKVV